MQRGTELFGVMLGEHGALAFRCHVRPEPLPAVRRQAEIVQRIARREATPHSGEASVGFKFSAPPEAGSRKIVPF